MSAKETCIKQIQFNSLSVRQAAKWLLLHERERHVQDIMAINEDLKKLNDVELPAELVKMAGNVRFEV